MGGIIARVDRSIRQKKSFCDMIAKAVLGEGAANSHFVRDSDIAQFFVTVRSRAKQSFVGGASNQSSEKTARMTESYPKRRTLQEKTRIEGK